MKELPNQTPKKDLMNSALKHYEEASAAIHHYNSEIPKAIKAYFSKPTRLSWNAVKELYMKFHIMDTFTENISPDIDFIYWLLEHHTQTTEQSKPVIDEWEMKGMDKFIDKIMDIGAAHDQCSSDTARAKCIEEAKQEYKLHVK